MIAAAVKVSILAMGIIFTVLTILIGVIQLLVKFIPYVEPPAPPARTMAPAATTAGSEEEAETLAAIHAAVAHHRGETPQAIQITNIQSN